MQKELPLSPALVPHIKGISDRLKSAGYECYMVGGSVRDLIMGNDVYDYDFATNARPGKIMELFRRAVPTGIKHGTVTVLSGDHSFEITTYRSDGKYIDGRRPETVSFSKSLEEDILRRDFTINGLAYDTGTCEIIDMVNGLRDIDDRIIRTIGSPMDRLSEDGLRSYRACRFSAKLEFSIEEATFEAIGKTLNISSKVSAERIRDEIKKILFSRLPSTAFEYMRKSGLLERCLPELSACFGIDQNKYHIYDVYYHSLYSCDAAPADKLIVRLAALMHDIGKVPSRSHGKDGDYTFYNHEVLGARMTKKAMRRLKFSNEEIQKVINLINNHMFHYTDDWTDGAVRRFMRKIELENLDDLFSLRLSDRTGNGSRGGLPEPIKILCSRIEKVIEDENAIKVTDLDINGHVLMSAFNLEPGPIIGRILNELLEYVLDDPSFNTRESLLQKAEEIVRESQPPA